jgi:capsule polysaccharide modification protein KpsS
MLNALPEDWNIFILKFIDKNLGIGERFMEQYCFNHPVFSRQFSENEIIGAEKWLEHSFYQILQFNYNWYSGFNNDEKHLWHYYQELARWVHFFRDYFEGKDLDFVVFDIDCRFPFVVCSLVARKLGMEVLTLGRGRVSKTFLVRDYAFNPIFWRDVSDSDTQTAKKFFVERYSKRKEPENPYVFRRNSKVFSFTPGRIKTDLIKLKRKLFPDETVGRLNRLQYIPNKALLKDRMSRQIRKFTIKYFLDDVDQGGKFLFFPLHHDLETHLSWGEHFIDQYDLIEKLSECLPIGVDLYVKPHPNWLGTNVPISKIRQIKEYGRVKLVNPRLDPLQLIKSSLGVVTINSTTGLEAIVLGKPVLTFGHNFYSKKDVTVCVHDLKSLPSAVNTILYKPNKSYVQKERDFLLSKYYKHFIFIQEDAKEKGDVIGKEDGENIASGLIDYCNHVKR